MKKIPLILLLVCLLLAACETGSLPGTDPAAPASQPGTVTTTPMPPTATPTSTPVPPGPCENPLMSLNVGNTWHYRSTSPLGSSEQVLRVVEWNEEVGINAVIEMEDLDTGTINQDWVTCLEDGGIEDFPLFFISLQLGDYLDGVLNTYYESGIYAPGYEQFTSQAWMLEWGAVYITEQSPCFRKVVSDITLCINLDSPIKLTFSTQGLHEDVRVAAGDFPQALVVSFTFRMVTGLIYPGIATSAPLTVTTTQWYAPYLGLVRSQVETASFEVISGAPSSMEVESVVELVEFTPAP